MNNIIDFEVSKELNNLADSIEQALNVPECPAAPFYQKQDGKILENILEQNKVYLQNHTYADLYYKWSEELLKNDVGNRLSFVRKMNVLFDEIFNDANSIETNTLDSYTNKLNAYQNIENKDYHTLCKWNYDIAKDVQKGKNEDFSLYQSAVLLLCLIIDDLYVCIEKEQP